MISMYTYIHIHKTNSRAFDAFYTGNPLPTTHFFLSKSKGKKMTKTTQAANGIRRFLANSGPGIESNRRASVVETFVTSPVCPYEGVAG
jgi:hypothetical protein